MESLLFSVVLSLVLFATPAFPQFPPAAVCRANAGRAERQLRWMRDQCNWEQCPLHWAFEDGIWRDMNVWTWAAMLQEGERDDVSLGELQQWIIEAIGEPAFRNGWLPPVPPWDPGP